MKVASRNVDVGLIGRCEFCREVIKTVKEKNANVAVSANKGARAAIIGPSALEERCVKHHKTALHALGIGVVKVVEFICERNHLGMIADDNLIADEKFEIKPSVMLGVDVASVIDVRVITTPIGIVDGAHYHRIRNLLQH